MLSFFIVVHPVQRDKGKVEPWPDGPSHLPVADEAGTTNAGKYSSIDHPGLVRRTGMTWTCKL